jgi:hypothetical protein
MSPRAQLLDDAEFAAPPATPAVVAVTGAKKLDFGVSSDIL